MTPPDVRTRILHEATRLFAERGYDATSIQAVAAAVGVTRPTLVYHFGSKEQLRNEVLEGLLTGWKDTVPQVLMAAQSKGDRFEGALGVVLSFFTEDPLRARLLVREMLDRPEEMAERFHVHLRPWTALLTHTIRAGQERGSVRLERDPEAYVLQILSAAIGTVAMGQATASILPNPPDVPRQLAELTRVARTALFTDPAE